LAKQKISKETVMAIEPKKPAPEIMPPAPDIQPEKRPEEIPQDIDAPQREAPEIGSNESF
jgi:hypothetical protein